MIQGINKLNIFETDMEKHTYLKYLNKEKKKYKIKVLAYAIMYIIENQKKKLYYYLKMKIINQSII